jgi:hypothetical protein
MGQVALAASVGNGRPLSLSGHGPTQAIQGRLQSRTGLVVAVALRHLRIGTLLAKVTPSQADQHFHSWMGPGAEPVQRGGRYDVVFAWNLHPLLNEIRQHTNAWIYAIAVEPPQLWPHNYDPELVDCCDRYVAYQPLSGMRAPETFRQWVYPAYCRHDLERMFTADRPDAPRDIPFAIFARHDPNLRRQIGESIEPHGGLLAGPLFDNPVDDKWTWQRRVKFEFITENVVHPAYVSEKIGQSLAAGCVPIYYGSPRAKALFGDDLVIDLHDFPNVSAAIDYCLQPGVWERYRQAQISRGRDLLRREHTWEDNVCTPFTQDLELLEPRPRRSTWRWRASRWWHSALRTA